MSNIFQNNKGFFQGGKSFGGKGFIEPLTQALQGIGQNLGQNFSGGGVSPNPNTANAMPFDAIIRDSNGLPIDMNNQLPIQPIKRKMKAPLRFQNNKFQNYNDEITQQLMNQGGMY